MDGLEMREKILSYAKKNRLDFGILIESCE